MQNKTQKVKVALIAGMADLYNRLFAKSTIEKLENFLEEIAQTIRGQDLQVQRVATVSTAKQAEQAKQEIIKNDFDLVVVALAPYCASGILAPILKDINTPIVLWPTQTFDQLDTSKIAAEDISLSHGVHAVQDLSNVLRRQGINFGLLHGHHNQPETLAKLKQWAQAAGAVSGLKNSNPMQIGGHFDDMLDLQIADAGFIKQLGLNCNNISADEFADALAQTDNAGLEQTIAQYKAEFDLAPDISDKLLIQTAKAEAAARKLIEQYNSRAIGINFQTLCNHPQIGDPLHVCASRLMAQGLGYAAEGDWVTASFVYAMQRAFEMATFTEMFSVGYVDNRLLLRHWGEANYKMAANKPKLAVSSMNDQQKSEFLVTDFQFQPTPVTLLNLNSTPDGNGQIITIQGTIVDDFIANYPGPQAIFKPSNQDIAEMLDQYAYAGGSHHLAMVQADARPIVHKIQKLTNWKYTQWV